MEYIWEETDIRGGMSVCKPRETKGGLSGWDIKWSMSIAGHSDGLYLFDMRDGSLSFKVKSIEEMIDFLNENELIPMSRNRMIETVNYLYDANASNE